MPGNYDLSNYLKDNFSMITCSNLVKLDLNTRSLTHGKETLPLFYNDP